LLQDEQKIALALELTPITASGFMRDISTKNAYDVMYRDVYDHVINCARLTVIRNSKNSPVAFVAADFKKLEEVKIYHLEGIILLSEVRGNSFGKDILTEDINENGADVLAFHTQSELMEKLGLKIADYDISLARKVAKLIGTGNLLDLPFGPADKGRYGGKCLYGDIEKFDSIAIKRTGFNYKEGDAIVFAGRIKRK